MKRKTVEHVRDYQSVRRSFRGKKTCGVLSLMLVLVAVAAASLQATPLYWDLNGTAANTGTSASGAWDGANLFWNTASTGTGGTPQAGTTSADDLFFSSGTNFTAASAIVISGAQVANSLTFQQTGAVTLSGTGITIGGALNPGLNFSNGTGANVISAPITLAADSAFTNSDNSVQTISGGITGAFNLTLNSNSTGGLTLSTGTVNNGGTITNSGSGTNTTTISSVVGSSVTGITQNSANSLLILSGANTAYAGTTTLTSGTLRGTNTANTNVLNAFGTGGINLNGGTLQLRANGTGNTQTIVAGNNVTIGNTATTIDVNNNGSNTSSSISLGNLSLGTGQLNVTGGNTYALRFTGSSNTLTGNATFNPTTANLTITGAIGDGGSGFGITKIGSGTLSLSGTNSYSGVTSVLAGTLNLSSLAPSGADGALGNATSDVLVGDTSGSLAATLQTTINSGVGIARNIRLQSGNTGTVTLIANAGGSGTGTISGNIFLGTDGGTGHGVTLGAGTGGNAQFASAAYSGVIQDPASMSGAGGVVTISGPGTVILSGANTYTGGTVLSAGTLRISNTQALGFGTFTINGGSISSGTAGAALTGITGQVWAGNFNFSGTAGGINLGTSAVTLTGSRTMVLDNGTVTVGGIISGAGYGLTLRGTGFSGTFNLNGANTYDGGTTVIGSTANFTVVSGAATALGTGQVSLGNSTTSRISLAADTEIGSLNSAIAAPTFTGGTGGTNGTQALVFTGGGGTGAAGTATISGGAITSISITNYGQGYTSAPTISLTTPGGTGTITTGFGSSNVNLNARTLTIAGTNASPAAYAGVISGTGGSLVKNGNGTQVLTGINTYTGSTTVSGGTLLISDSGSINSTSALTIATGGHFKYNSATAYTGGAIDNNGTISGNGTISAAVTLNSLTDILAPGNSPDIQGYGVNQTWSSFTYEWETNDFDTLTAGVTFDQIAVTGTLTLNGTVGSYGLDILSLTAGDLAGLVQDFSETNTTWTILTTTGGLSGFDDSEWTIDDSGFLNTHSGSFSLSADANNIYLNYTAVPEPSTYALVGIGLAGLWALRRKQRA